MKAISSQITLILRLGVNRGMKFHDKELMSHARMLLPIRRTLAGGGIRWCLSYFEQFDAR